MIKRWVYILFLTISTGLLFSQEELGDFNNTLIRREVLLDFLASVSTDDHSAQVLDVRKELSDIYIAQGNVSQALKYLLEAKLSFGQSTSDQDKYDVLYRLGKIYFDEEIYETALIYLNEIDTLGNIDNEEVESLKGKSYAAINENENAFSCFNNLYNISKAENRVEDQMKYLQQIVDLFYNCNQFEKALTYNYRLEKLIEDTPILREKYIIINNLGYNYTFLKKYKKAIEQFEKSLELIGNNMPSEKISILINMAICQNNMGNMDDAVEYFREALTLADLDTDAYSVAQINHLMATTYYKSKDFDTAFEYLNEAIKIADTEGFSSLLSESYYTAATINVEQNKFKEALNYFENYLVIRDSLSFEEILSQQRLVQEEIVLERLEKELELVRIDKALKKAEIDKLNLENNNLKLAKETLELNALKNRQQLELSKQQGTIQQEKLKNQDLQITKERQRLVIATNEKNKARQELELLRLNSEKEKQERELLEKDKLINEERQAAELLKIQSEIDQLEIANQKQYRKNSITVGILGTGLFTLLLSGVFYMLYANKKLNSQNIEIGRQRKKIESEKEISDNLLHNILPVPVANELKSTGAATPKRFEKVTVLFTDFSGFTRISSTLSPEKLIEDLEECFLAFDKIIEKYDIEKIKTIGDSFMCAGGVPVENDTNPLDCVLAAMEMQAYLEELYRKKKAAGREYWRMRVGIHTGPVVAGVIGNKKFSYDIWGDTVNVASRLESHGEIGKVNISQHTYDAVKDKTRCSYRGEIDVKNRGSLGMYFVDGLI